MLENGIQTRGFAGLDDLQQRHLHEDAFGSHLPLAPLRCTQHLHHAGESIGINEFGLTAQCSHLSLADIEQTHLAPRNHKKQQVAEMVEQVGQEASEVFAGHGQVFKKPQRRGDVAFQKGIDQLHELRPSGQPEHG